MGAERAGWDEVGEGLIYIARREGAKEPDSFRTFEVLALVVQRVDNTILLISYCQVDIEVCFANSYSLETDLSGEQRYSPFKQLNPEVFKEKLGKIK